MKMKVIDLLNKIANGEKPEKIKFNDIEYTWSIEKQDYDSFNTSHLKTGILGYIGFNTPQLNREIEIVGLIEEDKEIEDLKEGDFTDHEILKQLVCKTRQLISEVNELKKGK